MLSETIWRFTPFIVTLVVMATIEHVRPWRRSEQRLAKRWRLHIGLQVLAIILVRVSLPITTIGVAVFSQQHEFGLFHVLALPSWLELLLILVLLDLSIYGQHRLTHSWPLLWRLHRLHHSDRLLDVTTALRFHPVEILLSMVWKGIVVLALGASVESVLLFEIILSSAAIFNHANISLDPDMDRWLRRLLVTPDMHRVHHSYIKSETNSNYGFFLPWWDWIFGSYCQVSVHGEHVSIGLEHFGEAHDNTLIGMLSQPLRGDQAIALN